MIHCQECRVRPEGDMDPNFPLPYGVDEFGFVIGSEFGMIIARMERDPRCWYEPIHPENESLLLKWAWRLHRSAYTEPSTAPGWLTFCVNAGRIGL